MNEPLKKTKELVKVDDYEKNKHPLAWFNTNEIPLLTRCSRFTIFAATNRKVKGGLVQVKETKDMSVVYVTKPTIRIFLNSETGEVERTELGSLNDFDKRIWYIIEDKALQNGIFHQLVYVTVYEILKELEYKKIGSREYERVRDSIERLTDCNLSFEFTCKKTGSKLHHMRGALLKEATLFRPSGKTKNSSRKKKDKSYIIINDWIYREITKTKFITKLNYKIAKKLRSALARWIYERLSVDCSDTVALDMPYIKKYTAQTKIRGKEVESAANELIKVGVIETWSPGKKLIKGKYINTFTFTKSKKILDFSAVKPDIYHKKLIAFLRANFKTIKDQITDIYPNKDVEKYIAMLQFNERNLCQKINNRFAWLLQALKNNWKGTEHFEKLWSNGNLYRFYPGLKI